MPGERDVDHGGRSAIKAGMTTNPWSRLAVALGIGVTLVGLSLPASAAPPPPVPVSLGHDTYRLTRSSRWAFSFNTEKLERLAREDAAKFCTGMGRKMKEVSISSDKASLLYGGFSQATIVFKALDPSDPEFGPAAGAAPPSDRQMLEALHDRQLLSDAEYQAAKQRLTEKSGEMEQLLELRQKGILSEAEFEAAKARLLERAK